MCKASILAEKWDDRKKGNGHGVTISDHGVAAFHHQGQSAANCVVCLQTGDNVMVNNIPPHVQAKYGLRSTETQSSSKRPAVTR